MSLRPCVATLNRARSVTPPSFSVALSPVQSQETYCLLTPVTTSWDLETQNNGRGEKSGIADAAFLPSSIYNFLFLKTANCGWCWCSFATDSSVACISKILLLTLTLTNGS